MTKNEYKEIINFERNLYLPSNKIQIIKYMILGSKPWWRWKLVHNIRRLEYYGSASGLIYKVLYQFEIIRHNNLERKLGIEIGGGVFGKGLEIFHTNGIVINGYAKVGENCKLHGGNVIGNKGNDLKAPVLGNNVRLGAGAVVLGDVYIADDVQIGAGAVVVKSCYQTGAILTGVPAGVLNKVRSEESEIE